MVNQGGITISVQPTECKAAAAQSWVGLPLYSPADDGGGGDDYDDDDFDDDGNDGKDYDTAAAAQSWIELPLSSGFNTWTFRPDPQEDKEYIYKTSGTLN